MEPGAWQPWTLNSTSSRVEQEASHGSTPKSKHGGSAPYRPGGTDKGFFFTEFQAGRGGGESIANVNAAIMHRDRQAGRVRPGDPSGRWVPDTRLG